VARLGGDGAPAWVQPLGSPAADQAEALAVGADGTVVVGGRFAGPLALGALAAEAQGDDDLFVAALAADGAPRWLFTAGGPEGEAALALAPTPDGGFLAAGGFFGELAFGELTLTTAGDEDAFLLKLSADGAVQWVRRYGGPRDERIQRLAVDAQGSIYALVAFFGTTNLGGEALVSAGSFDLAVAKLDASGAHLWSRGFGGPDDDAALGLAVDPAGNVAWAGAFDRVLAVGADRLVARGTADVVVASLTPDGQPRWARRFGEDGEDVATSVAVDPAGNVVVAGWFERSVDFGAGPLTARGGKDAFVAKLDAAGTTRWARALGDRQNDKVRGLAVAAEGDVYAAGLFRFSLPTPTPLQFRLSGANPTPGSDAFVLRLGR
jgi:hypothetical protein